MNGGAVAHEHFGVAALLAGEGADDEHGRAGHHGFGGGEAAGFADEQAGVAHHGGDIAHIAANAYGMLELVPGGQQLLAQAPVGAGDDINGEVAGGAVKLANGGEARAESARAAHDEHPAPVQPLGTFTVRGLIGLNGNAEGVDAFAGNAENHEALDGGFGGDDVANVIAGRHKPEAVRQEVGHDTPQRDGFTLAAGIGREHGEGMGLGADDGIGLKGIHQDAEFVAVAALDERANPLGEPVEPEVIVERLPQFRGAADGGHVGILHQRAPCGVGGFEQIEAAGFRVGALAADFGLDGARGGMVTAVAHEVANQNARGGAAHETFPRATSSPA